MKKVLLSLCSAALVFSVGIHARANTILPNSGYSANAEADQGNPETVGYDFTVGSTPLLVTALGLWDGPQAAAGTFNGSTGMIGDGFANQHTVGLWDSAGNLLGSVIIQPGTAVPLSGEFRYVNLVTPVVLLAGTKYVLGSSLAADDPDSLDVIFGAIPSDPAVTSGNFRESDGAFGFPADLGFAGGQIGPNAMFTLLTNGHAVPEAGVTGLLLFISLAGLLGARRVVRF